MCNWKVPNMGSEGSKWPLRRAASVVGCEGCGPSSGGGFISAPGDPLEEIWQLGCRGMRGSCKQKRRERML